MHKALLRSQVAYRGICAFPEDLAENGEDMLEVCLRLRKELRVPFATVRTAILESISEGVILTCLTIGSAHRLNVGLIGNGDREIDNE